MYLLRRIAKAQQGKVWEVAGLMSKVCGAYEENGRNEARVYVSWGLPGTPNVVYAEWTQETIETNRPSNVPDSVRALNAEMFSMLTEPWSIEFYELVTPEALKERNVS